MDPPTHGTRPTGKGVSAAAILDSLKAPVALLDQSGVITSVNEAWQRFTDGNSVSGQPNGIGKKCFDVCDKATGTDAEGAHAAAGGIRRVLNGSAETFSMEYPCHSPDEERWFEMTATPVAAEPFEGVVVMHVNITERVKSQTRITRLNRVYAVLSGISTLIIQAHSREDLLKGGCKIAVEQGGFQMAWVGLVDREKRSIIPIECVGTGLGAFVDLHEGFSYAEGSPFSENMVVRSCRTMEAIVSNDIRCDGNLLFSSDMAALGIVSKAICRREVCV